MSQSPFQNMQSKEAQPNFPNRDPFYVVKERVQELDQKLKQETSRWQTLYQGNTARPEFEQTTKSIRQLIKQINAYLFDLQRTIDIVDKNRSRFASISDQELESRRDFVAKVKTATTQIEKTIDSEATKQKILADQRASLMEEHKRSSSQSGLDREFSREATGYVEGKMQRQQQLESKQDEILDDMGSILDRLQVVSTEMNTELKEQDVVINDIHDEVDTAQRSMGVALNKIEKLLNSSDKGRWCCIGFLILSALILFIAIIY